MKPRLADVYRPGALLIIYINIVRGANRLWGESSMMRNAHGAKRLWGEMSFRGAKCPWGEMSFHGAKCPWGEMSVGRKVHKPAWQPPERHGSPTVVFVKSVINLNIRGSQVLSCSSPQLHWVAYSGIPSTEPQPRIGSLIRHHFWRK